MNETVSAVLFSPLVALEFNGPRLHLFVWPVVTTVGAEPRGVDDVGYRDALCELVGCTVIAAGEQPGNGLTIDLVKLLAQGQLVDDNVNRLVVNPRMDDVQGPEIALLQMNNESRAWQIWRPGEGTFASVS